MGVFASEVAGLAITGSWILSFTSSQLVCIFLLVCWSHRLKLLLRTLFQFSEFSLCYPDSCFLFSSFLPLVSQASLRRHYGFRHCSAFLTFFPGASFMFMLSWLRLSSFFIHFCALLIETFLFRYEHWSCKHLQWCVMTMKSPWLCLSSNVSFSSISFKGCFPAYSHLDSLSGCKHIVSHFPCFCGSGRESCCNFGVFFSIDDLRFSPTTLNIVCLLFYALSMW